MGRVMHLPVSCHKHLTHEAVARLGKRRLGSKKQILYCVKTKQRRERSLPPQQAPRRCPWCRGTWAGVPAGRSWGTSAMPSFKYEWNYKSFRYSLSFWKLKIEEKLTQGVRSCNVLFTTQLGLTSPHAPLCWHCISHPAPKASFGCFA